MDGISAYKENALTTQSPGRVVVLLYEGAIRSLRRAIVALEAGQFVPKGRYIRNAQDILDQLNGALDTDAGGELADHLRSLYLYMNRQLNQANFHRDCQPIREVIALLEVLNEGWKTVTN